MLEDLRKYWSFHRHPRWLFPNVGRGDQTPLTHRQSAFTNLHSSLVFSVLALKIRSVLTMKSLQKVRQTLRPLIAS